MDAIRVDNLTKRYGDHVAVAGIGFDVRQGEAFGILGPNGAGKTTTLEMIEGLRRPDTGTVEVLGEPVWPDPRRIQARIGVQLQSTALFDRSEEHTSELQSRPHLVCRLLLEKKKNNPNTQSRNRERLNSANIDA